MNLTAANQLTILRMLLIPAFVILLMFRLSRLGAGFIFRSRHPSLFDGLSSDGRLQKTTLGAWAQSDGGQAVARHDVRDADPARHRFGESSAALVHGPLVISRDVAMSSHRRRREPRSWAAHLQAVHLRQNRDRHLHHCSRGRGVVFQLPQPGVITSCVSFVYASLAITFVSAFHYLGQVVKLGQARPTIRLQTPDADVSQTYTSWPTGVPPMLEAFKNTNETGAAAGQRAAGADCHLQGRARGALHDADADSAAGLEAGDGGEEPPGRRGAPPPRPTRGSIR